MNVNAVLGCIDWVSSEWSGCEWTSELFEYQFTVMFDV